MKTRMRDEESGIGLRMAAWFINFEAVSATPQTGFNRVIIASFRI